MAAVLLLPCLIVTLASAQVPFRASVKDAKGEPVADAVVSLHGETPGPSRTPTGAVEVVQQDQEYVPYVTAITVGSRVDFPNKDSIQHHIYSLSKAKRFEKPLYAPGARESIVFDQPGVVTLGCNIHDWMVAYIVVLPTPYFAKSDAGGIATTSAPGGKYRVEVWHPRLAKPVTSEITLAEGMSPMEISVALKPDRRVRRAPDAKSAGY